MSHTSPLNIDELKKSTYKFKVFFFLSASLIILLIMLMFCFPTFFHQKNIWTLGSIFTFFSVVSNKYFDIKKNANKRNLLLPPIPNEISAWLKIEKLVSYLWILGFSLLIISRWLNY